MEVGKCLWNINFNISNLENLHLPMMEFFLKQIFLFNKVNYHFEKEMLLIFIFIMVLPSVSHHWNSKYYFYFVLKRKTLSIKKEFFICLLIYELIINIFHTFITFCKTENLSSNFWFEINKTIKNLCICSISITK